MPTQADVRLAQAAVKARLLTTNQAREALKAQKLAENVGVRSAFLNVAVDKGLLTASQAKQLTHAQGLDEEYRRLLDYMGIDEPITIDDLVERCGLTAEAVSSMLLILELRGFVISRSGGAYARSVQGLGK